MNIETTPYESLEPHYADSIDMAEHIRNYQDFYKEDLIAEAATARDWAVSHRQPMFQVGCSIMTKPGDEKRDYSIYSGHNYKPHSGPPLKGSMKRCAERNAVEKAIDNDAELIIAMITVSRETSTGDPTRAHDALHPCPDCRAMMRALKEKGMLKGDSIICNVNDSKMVNGRWAEEERTVDELLTMYQDEETPRASGF